MDNNIDFIFKDIRNTPNDKKTWQLWMKQVGVEKLLNKRSTSWRQLSAEQQSINFKDSRNNEIAVQLFIQYPTLMKRPLLLIENQIVEIGFVINNYQHRFEQH